MTSESPLNTNNPLLAHRMGLGTWQMGESSRTRQQEIAAIELALDIGYRLIDTAEMYGNGRSEEIVGEALRRFGAARRSEIAVVSKVLPSHASKAGAIAACERSLARLQCDYLDVYLLHWQGSYSYEETLEAFHCLHERGMIRAWGVSNFDAEDFAQWQRVERQHPKKVSLVTNQVYYALSARGVEFDLLPAMQEQGLPLMAYSPLGCGELSRHPRLQTLAKELGLTASQLALAWLLNKPGVIPIPKSANPERIRENWLFITKGGQRYSLNLFLRRNRFNGGNTDVPEQFYIGVIQCAGGSGGPWPRHSRLGWA